MINGQDLATHAEAAKASLGFIPDRPFIYEKLTAGEFLRFHGGLYGMDGDGIGHRVAEGLELPGRMQLLKGAPPLIRSHPNPIC